MTVYLDTSDLVKLYVDEPDSEEVVALIDRLAHAARVAVDYT